MIRRTIYSDDDPGRSRRRGRTERCRRGEKDSYVSRQGFYCVTCAVGVDALLEKQKGVVRSQSDYKAATTTITYHPELVSEDQLKASIAEMGFHAE